MTIEHILSNIRNQFIDHLKIPADNITKKAAENLFDSIERQIQELKKAAEVEDLQTLDGSVKYLSKSQLDTYILFKHERFHAMQCGCYAEGKTTDEAIKNLAQKIYREKNK